MENRKLKFVRIKQRILAEMLMQGIQHYEIIKNALPEDAHIVNASYCAPCQADDLVEWSSEYETVPEGCPIPMADATEAKQITETKQ